jgi:UDP:flavonoid glycosyltransferase YjiC (YdhE family)
MSSFTQTTPSSIKPGTKVLFASFPADGHYNPLTGLAVHLKERGCDVRWYTSATYQQKTENLGIPFYPLKRAVDFSALVTGAEPPERARCKTAVAKLNFDIIHAFVLRGAEYYEDIKEIYAQFPFEVVIADVCFTGIPFITDKLRVPVVAVGVFPLANTSKDLPPSGLGLTPAGGFFGRLKQGVLRWLARNVLFAKSNKVLKKEFERYGISGGDEFVFDVLYSKADVVLQSGCPGFEYKRSDLSPKIKFVGPLLPFRTAAKKDHYWYDDRLLQYSKVVLVTQGTVETNVDKIMAPTLEAFKDSGVLVIGTTGGNGTEALRKRFPQHNIIIEDFIPFCAVMPYVNAYVTNGGYGGVMLGIQHNLPLVVAGVHEGKNEICARIGYFKLGINLKTETPLPAQIRHAVSEVISNPVYQINVEKLNNELAAYHPAQLCEETIAQLVRSAQKEPAIEWEMVTESKQAV